VTVAVVGVTVAVVAGCPTTTGVKGGGTIPGGTTTTGFASPLVFSASGGTSSGCIYTYDTGAPGASQFTLKYGGKGITVSATYGGGTGFYDPPPGSMQITYGDSSPYDFDSGLLSLSPAGKGITVTDNRPTSWTMTTVGSGSALALTWGKKWNITFSCGALANCCANTSRISVAADGTVP
jgi:hypothetical protein